MDYTVDELAMEKDTSDPSENPSRIAGLNKYLQLTPSATSQPTPRPRRSTVSIACERCRKRKTKCSGLPGPCTNCARLNVACHEPGRRKSTVQSTLEERMQRLRTLSAANQLAQDSIRRYENQGSFLNVPDARQLPRIQTTDFGGDVSPISPWDVRALSPASIHSSEGWPTAGDSASYFENRFQGTLDWNMSDYPSENASTSSDHVRQELDPNSARTLPDHTQNAAFLPQNISPHEGAGFAIPTHISTPSIYEPTPERLETHIGFTISYDSNLDEQDLNQSNSNGNSPFNEEKEFQQAGGLNVSGLRPMRQSSYSQRPSTKSSPTLSTRALHSNFEASTHREQLSRSKTLPTSHPAVAEPENEGTDLLSLIIRSDDTQRYIGNYFSTIHNEYPFIDLAILQRRKSFVDQISDINYNSIQQQTMLHFQALLAAGIGALVQYESTTVSSQYVKQAVSIQDQFEMWNSVSGVHCAMLLALYCYLAQRMVYDTRQDESAESQHLAGIRHSRYPVSNLWLHNCQIVAACIDLGMHQPLAMQEQIRSHSDIKGYLELCRNTIRSAYVMDRRISELRNRPRAFHDSDVDRTLLLGL